MREQSYGRAVDITMGPMRVLVGKDAPPPALAIVYPWTLKDPPANDAVDYGMASSAGASKLVSDSQGAAALRSLRETVLRDAEATPGFFYGIIYIDRMGEVMSMRDDLPFTDSSDGLWRPPK